MLRARLGSAQEQVRVAQESVDVAQVQLDNTVIRAPFDGVVTAKTAQPGEMISPVSAGGGFTRTGIGTIVDMDSLEIQVDVNESFINRVTPGQPVEAMLNAYPDWKIPASVIAIIPAADRAKATVKVRIAIKARDARLVPDMGVRVAFLESERKGPADRWAAWWCRPRPCAARGRPPWSSCTPTARWSGAPSRWRAPRAPASRADGRAGGRAGRALAAGVAQGRRVREARRQDLMADLVQVRGVTKSYRRGGETIEVLHGVDLDIPRGDFVALMGPSGSGKTTLLNLIGGLDTPTGGSIVVDGRRIDRLSSGELSAWRAAHVGFVFQFYNLLPVLSAQRNVELPLLLTSLSAAERRRHAAVALAPGRPGRPRTATSRRSSPADRSSAWPSRARSSPIPRCWSATSPPATSTARRRARSWRCCRCSTASTARRS
jgi:hypothetical protein